MHGHYFMAPRSAKRGVAAGRTRQDAPRQCPHFTTTHAHAHRDRLSWPDPAPAGSSAPLISRSFPCGSVAFAWIQSYRATHAGRGKGRKGKQSRRWRRTGARRRRARAHFPCPCCSATPSAATPRPPRPQLVRACDGPGLPSTPIGAPLRARTSQSMPPHSPPHLPAPSLTRQHPTLRAPLLFSGRPVAD
uniref:Uncharacterized protein n=1 Tax=Setaria viridis TaxID=4556 RepID=A0A4U6UPQ2_SETVI|nr:hypothetical protein SEVIR_5G352766v2 [Setaria viridis]